LQRRPRMRMALSASRRAGEQADAPDDDAASDAGADSDDDEDRRRRLGGGGGGGGARAGGAAGGADAAAAGGAGGDDMPDVQARGLRGGFRRHCPGGEPRLRACRALHLSRAQAHGVLCARGDSGLCSPPAATCIARQALSTCWVSLERASAACLVTPPGAPADGADGCRGARGGLGPRGGARRRRPGPGEPALPDQAPLPGQASTVLRPLRGAPAASWTRCFAVPEGESITALPRGSAFDGDAKSGTCLCQVPIEDQSSQSPVCG
jgi:hypothetical protein